MTSFTKTVIILQNIFQFSLVFTVFFLKYILCSSFMSIRLRHDDETVGRSYHAFIFHQTELEKPNTIINSTIKTYIYPYQSFLFMWHLIHKKNSTGKNYPDIAIRQFSNNFIYKEEKKTIQTNLALCEKAFSSLSSLFLVTFSRKNCDQVLSINNNGCFTLLQSHWAVFEY